MVTIKKKEKNEAVGIKFLRWAAGYKFLDQKKSKHVRVKLNGFSFNKNGSKVVGSSNVWIRWMIAEFLSRPSHTTPSVKTIVGQPQNQW